jgi:hypothetical protein
VIVTTAAAPSSPSIRPPGSLGDSTIGPRIRLSSGSSHALLPRRLRTPATRACRRRTTRRTSPSTPRRERDEVRTATVSPCIAPFIDSGGT